jgi:pteridine reductase
MSQSKLRLSGRVAVVTGAGVRLGRAIALALAGEGADIVVHYGRSRDDAERTAAAIRDLGRRAVTVSADLAHPAAAATTIFDAAATLGSADVLVNSAAIFEDASLAATTDELYDRHLAINLKAPCFLCREFVRRLPAGRTACIVNLADWRAETPPADFLAYTLSKAGVVALTKALALQLAPQVRVNAIAPGAMLPPPGEEEEPWRSTKLPEIPLRRTGSPDDIAAAAVYLVNSNFVTGEVLHVTGGEHL